MDSRTIQLWDSIKKGVIALSDPAFQTPRLIRLRKQLEEANAEIARLQLDQIAEGHVRPDSETTIRLRDALRVNHLLPISEDAEVLLEGMPGIAEDFRVPHKRTKDADLLAAAKRILGNAKRYEAVFIDGKWDPAFIADAEAAADALRLHLANGNTVMNRRSRASASIPSAVRKGRKIMESVNRTVATQLSGNTIALARWKSAHRVPKKPGRPKNNRRGRRIDLPTTE